jgi:ribose 1,5-bisphosphokinase PhnN
MLSKQLVSVNRRISNNRGVVNITIAKDSIVQRLVIRAKEEVSNIADLNLLNKKKKNISRGRVNNKSSTV